ncbi:MAG TPA: alpha/beta hydrolase [candidate division Zixibacteria bacterium]|nr:alpha/beta hydrolase [candidate division Zixibacteria bacterium]
MGRVKSLDEIKAEIRSQTGKKRVFRRLRPHDVERVVEKLTSKDPELWAELWAGVALRYEEEGAEHERHGRIDRARESYFLAYAYYAAGRYPVPHTPGKLRCFHKSLELYEKAGRYFDPPLERVEVPYGGGKIPAYLRLKRGGERRPTIVNFGGIDGFKAEAYEYEEAMHAAGLNTCAIDMPGTGESPIKATPEGESLFSAVIDYLERRPEVDPARLAMVGRSFGGYWAAKMAFVEAERLRAAVVWGGGVHYFFQEEWLRRSTNAESYLMDHDVARCMAFGVGTIDELARIFPSMSLKTQGWLDKPSCAMLVVNGKDDLQTPIDDLYILLEHGSPKSARVFPGGHMGQTPETLPTILGWLRRELR